MRANAPASACCVIPTRYELERQVWADHFRRVIDMDETRLQTFSQWEVMAACERISEVYLLPVLQDLPA